MGKNKKYDPDNLTPEQQARLEAKAKEFQLINDNTDPTDKPKAEAAIRKVYEYMAKKDKKSKTDFSDLEFEWFDSPFAAAHRTAQHIKGDTDVTEQEVREQAGTCTFGSFEAYWVATYDLMVEEMQVPRDELLPITIAVIKECGPYWALEDLVVASKKPTVVKTLNGKLHCLTGPALAYEDGYHLYAVNGVHKKSLMECVLAAGMSDESEE